MKKIILIVAFSIIGIFGITAGIFGVQHHYKQLEIQEAQQRVEFERLRKLQELKDCQELIGVFSGKIKDDERSRLLSVSGDLEKTRQQLLLICEDRKSFWDSRMTEYSQEFDRVEKLVNEAKQAGAYFANVQEAEKNKKEELRTKWQEAKEQKEGFEQNYDKIAQWSHSPYS